MLRDVIDRGTQGASWLVCAAAFLGCGAGARMALQSPISKQCQSAGLKGCDDLTEGTLLILDGQTADGRPKLQHGAAENSPERVRQFAQQIRSLALLPGAGSYGKELAAVADMLDVADASPVAESAKVAPPPPPEKPVHVENAEPVATQADSLRAGVVVPGLDTRAYECAVGEAGKTGSFSGSCVRALVGPAIVTDLHLTGTCPATLFVFSGKPDRPTWFMLSTTGGLAVHGASMLVPESESFVIGLRAGGVAAQGKDLGCGIAWGATRLQGMVLFSGR